MPKKELLRIIFKLKRITENLSRNGLNKIERINHLSLNALEQMAMARHIKN